MAARISYYGNKMGSPYRERRSLVISVSGDPSRIVEKLDRAIALLRFAKISAPERLEMVTGSDFAFESWPYDLGISSNWGGCMDIIDSDVGIIIDAEHNQSGWHTTILITIVDVLAEVTRPSGAWGVAVASQRMIETWIEILEALRDATKILAESGEQRVRIGDPLAERFDVGTILVEMSEDGE